MAPLLHLTLLGIFGLHRGDRLVAAGVPARLPDLMAYLVLHGDQDQARRDLAFRLWPDTSEPQAQTNLRKLLHYLRTALPELTTSVQIEARALRWTPTAGVYCDLEVFITALDCAAQAESTGDVAGQSRALHQAVAAYGGDLLRLSGAEWVLPVREDLRRRFMAALERLILILEAAQDYPAALAAAQRLVAEDPLHEAGYRYLMRLQAAAGDRAAAVHVYHTATSVLQRELGVAPSPTTQAAYAALLAAPPAPGAGRADRFAEAGLVGRQAEWAALHAAWAAAQAGGQPDLVLLVGDGGIGKTRLAEEFLTWAAHQGIATATARCYAAETGLAYGPVIAWLRAHHRRTGVAPRSPELARLLPELAASAPAAAEPLGEQYRFFEALVEALLPDQPGIYLLDDMQWCDPETLVWLPFLLRCVAHAPRLVVGTVRPEDVGADHPLHEVITTQARAGRLHEIALGPLNAEETAALGAALATPPLPAIRADRLYAESEGNPLLVVELVRAALEPATPGALLLARPPHGGSTLPPRVQALFQARLARLSDAARGVAHLAAVIGREFRVAVLARTSGLAEGDLVTALDELWQRRILREQGDEAYTFSHDKLREVVYSSLNPTRRRMLHRQVAQALASTPAGGSGVLQAEIAAHYAAAGHPADAVQYYQQAAAAALAMLAPTTAVQALERAIALLPAAQERVPAGDWVAVGADLYAGLSASLTQVGRLAIQRARPALSAFQARKIRRVFAAFDRDDDGFMEAADHLHMTRAVAALRGWTPESPEYALVASIFMGTWDQLQAGSGGEGRVGWDVYQAYMGAALGDPEGFLAAAGPAADFIFDLFDRDGDGHLTVAEYGVFLHLYRGRAADASAVVARLDPAGNGAISKEAFRTRFCEFHLSDDPQVPGNWFLGPL